ncbi:hypothetical protein D3C77_588060 [compost metagenome]
MKMKSCWNWLKWKFATFLTNMNSLVTILQSLVVLLVKLFKTLMANGLRKSLKCSKLSTSIFLFQNVQLTSLS